MRSSDGRTTVWPVSPWRRALREERCLPATVRGPVELLAFSRLVSARLLEEAPFAVSVFKVSVMIFPICHWFTMRILGWRGIWLEVVEGEGVNKVGFGVTATSQKRRYGGASGQHGIWHQEAGLLAQSVR